MAKTDPVTITVEVGRTPGVEIGGDGAGVRFDDTLDLGSIELG